MKVFEQEVFWVTLTLLVFYISNLVYTRWKKPYFNPVLISVTTIILFIKISNAQIEEFNKHTSIIDFFLGPAVVSLGYLLHQQWKEIAKNFKAIFISIGVSSLIGILSVAGIAHALGADNQLIATLSPKSVTTPIAIGIASKTGGIPPLTAAIVIAVGVFGAVIGSWFLTLLKIKHPFARGLAFGTASHGIGTARALDEGDTTGTAAALGIGLTGIFTVFYIFIITIVLEKWEKIQETVQTFFISLN